MQGLRIIGLTVFAAICYGILHDQVTARICVEYFTIGHPPLLSTESPTLLAIGWGIVATWWVALPLGVLLAAAARLGRRPQWTIQQLRRPLTVVLLGMGACAALAGVVGGILAVRGDVSLLPPMSALIPADRQVPFLVDLWMHSASYLAGMIGGLWLALWTWRQRGGQVVTVPDAAPPPTVASAALHPASSGKLVVQRWRKIVLGSLALLLAVALVVAHVVNVGITEFYSRDWHSGSSRESANRGLLIARLPVRPDSVTLDGGRLAVLEAWVEPQTHEIYRYYLFHRVIRDSTKLLLVHTSMPTGIGHATGRSAYLAYNDSLGLSAHGSEYWIGAVHDPLPDTVRLFTRDHW